MNRTHPAIVFLAGFIAGGVFFALLIPSEAATSKSDEARALENIARILERKCRP